MLRAPECASTLIAGDARMGRAVGKADMNVFVGRKKVEERKINA